jgi:branched-chain amino acid transport system permease protein
VAGSTIIDVSSERAAKPRLLKWSILALVAVALLVYPFVFTGPFPRHLMILVLLYAMLGQGWNILGGYAGQVSLGHAVYFGVAAYASVMFQLGLGLPAWPAVLLGGVAAILLSLVIGMPTFRLAGHYFAIATIATGEILRIVFQNWEYAGAAMGLTLPIQTSSLWHLQFNDSKLGYYFVILVMLALTMLTVAWLERSRYGYYFRAIKGDPHAAAALGIDLARYKLLANALSALVTGLGGAFYAQYVLYIDPTSVMPSLLSVLVMLIPVLGGVGTLWGPVIGAAILIPISEMTRVYFGGANALDLLIYGILIILFMMFQPAGLLGLFRRGRRGGAA